MRRLVIILVMLSTGAAIAADLPCAHNAVSFQSVPHDAESVITLEAQRVRKIDGEVCTYDLGKETITITADSFAASRFLKDVGAGRCSARETVRLMPDRKSPLNSRFKAARPH